MRASSGPRFWSDFFELFSKIMKKTKPESLAGVWEICDVRQRHIEIWCSSEFKVDHFRGRTGPRSQSVDETRSKWISSQTLVALINASRPGLPGESSYKSVWWLPMCLGHPRVESGNFLEKNPGFTPISGPGSYLISNSELWTYKGYISLCM